MKEKEWNEELWLLPFGQVIRPYPSFCNNNDWQLYEKFLFEYDTSRRGY